MDNALLTIPQVMERLSVSRTTLYRMMASNELTPLRLSDGIVRFEVEELERFLRTRRKATPPKGARP